MHSACTAAATIGQRRSHKPGVPRVTQRPRFLRLSRSNTRARTMSPTLPRSLTRPGSRSPTLPRTPDKGVESIVVLNTISGYAQVMALPPDEPFLEQLTSDTRDKQEVKDPGVVKTSETESVVSVTLDAEEYSSGMTCRSVTNITKVLLVGIAATCILSVGFVLVNEYLYSIW